MHSSQDFYEQIMRSVGVLEQPDEALPQWLWNDPDEAREVQSNFVVFEASGRHQLVDQIREQVIQLD
jgi:hypothetical protein